MAAGEVLRSKQKPDIAVVIPSYRVRNHILAVLSQIGSEVTAIYVVDDACPEDTGRFVEEHVADRRVKVLWNSENLGVGGATLAGMKQAAADGADVIVKIDGDGQMDPALIPSFVNVILTGEADYAKGNRFFDPEGVASMPLGRLIGNAGLSFLAKISTGYWHSFDPTNGFFAIHASLVGLLPLEKISRRFFFESDLLFRLNVLTARVVDVPMHSHYADEVSNMKPHREIPRFALAHLRNFGKRIFYNYFIRNFSIASLELVLGLALLLFGVVYGLSKWGTAVPATAGTVMMAALPIIVATQLLLAFINYDIQSVPRSTLHLRLENSLLPMKSLMHQSAKATKKKPSRQHHKGSKQI
ncbi:glycosyltransferase family 2 protein [Mesorhizobium opportunistum]|uniref:Glycosyl transferase family 2 n=1 Tax=Mesorhizobium opportunistum (strain LMG 24607 / HAMBI 3007 / WSM2075) TaxID=536019 RepID=F7Y0U2_MESOW|nr:glycosyltransferase family 2 protein [Mesorhizobium opportunistum]AEH87073.1 glycosyl transferase family 2 [Mesorhizobium opportunistum WSM2075]